MNSPSIPAAPKLDETTTRSLQANANLVAGFYWARRKDGRALTVVEVVTGDGGHWVQTIRNLNCSDMAKAAEFFEILERIAEPKP
jgi:hypothetical protein